MKRLFIIFFIGFLLRVVGLTYFPSGFTPDEASFGYDAYSLIATGRDQWGKMFPLVLESFGDFKPPLYSYLAVPSVLLFGLNEFAVRLPNALSGAFAVLFTYLFTLELAKRTQLKLNQVKWVALFASLLLAISPWHIMLSRGAFEANLTSLFISLGGFLFLRGLKKPRLMILSSVIFGLNLFTYHSPRLVTPLIVISLIVFFWQDFKKSSKKIVFSAIFALFLAGAFYTLFIGGIARAKDISVFGGSIDTAATRRLDAINSGTPFIVAKILHNKYTVTLEHFVDNYTQYSSYKLLYKEGPREGTYGMIPGQGVSYWFELPFLIGFLYFLIKHPNKKPLVFLLFWLIIAPIPAALTAGRGHAANRAATMLPALQIMYALGAFALLTFVKQKSPKILPLAKLVYGVSAIVMIISFLNLYFIKSPEIIGQSMLSGNMEAARLLAGRDEGKRILVSRRLSEPHIFIAFAKKWPPADYQNYSQGWTYKMHGVTWLDQMPEYTLGNYTFSVISPETMTQYDYVVGRPDEFSPNIETLEIIRYPNGNDAIYIVDPNIQQFAYAD